MLKHGNRRRQSTVIGNTYDVLRTVLRHTQQHLPILDDYVGSICCAGTVSTCQRHPHT